MQRTPTCKNCCRNYCFPDKNKAPNIPLLLECGHTFCAGCITKLARLHKTQVICPECTHPTVLVQEGEAGATELQPNVYIMGILATNAYRKSLLERIATKKSSAMQFKLTSNTGMQQAVALITRQRKTQEIEKQNSSHGLKCEECFSATAISRCIKCECVFCAKCFEKVHSSLHTLRKHKPFSLIDISADTSTGCALHENRPFEFFDKDDNKPVCSHCVVVGEIKMHDVVPIEQMAEGIKEELQQSLKDGKIILLHLEHSQKKISEASADGKSDKIQLISDIREHFQYMSAHIQVRENILVKALESSRSSGEALEMTVAEDIKKSRNLIMELEETLDQPSKLISHAKGFMTDLEELRRKPCFVVKTNKPGVEESRFTYDEGYLDSMRTYGEVKETEAVGFELKKLSDVNEDELNQQSDEEETESLISEESSIQDDNDADSSTDGRRSMAARKLLSIPYRHELVQVTHIRDPSYFMVQRLADIEQLHVMMNTINKYCDTSDASDLVLDANVGDMVCAQFTVDNHWYRARVLSMHSPSHHNVLPTLENGLNVQVMYSDFGNSEWIPMIRLRTMPARFLQVPGIAVCCSLVDIVPPFQLSQWPPKAVKAFGSLTGDKPLIMTASRRGIGGMLHVDLKSPEDDEPTRDDDRPASVRDALVFLEVARFRSPASESNLQALNHSFPMRSFKDPSSIEVGQTIPVLISHVMSPNEIYLQKLDGDEVSQLLYTMQEMERLYNKGTRRKDLKILWPYRGLVCSAQFTEDGSWYRAWVTGVNSDETVNVMYVDYGNVETLRLTAIRKLPDALLALPRQAHLACLADVKPSDGDQDEAWSDQVRDVVCMLLLNKQFDASIIDISNGKASVVLHDTTSDKNASVNDLLVQCHRAVPTGLGIVKNYPDDKPEKTVEKDNSPEEKEEEKPDDKEKVEDEDDINNKVTEIVEKTDEKPREGSEKTPQEEAVVSMEIKGDEREVNSSMSGPERRVLVQYQPAVLPVDRQFQAAVTYVGLNGSIYVQELKEGDRTLINLMENLHKRYKNTDENPLDTPTSTGDLFIGQPCAALFSDDGMWYRALVTKVIGQDKVEVMYVDFGNSEVVPLSALRLTAMDMDVPKQCLQLVLNGVQTANLQGGWTGEAISFLSEMIVGKDCSAIIEGVKVPGQPLEVRLCSPDGANIADALQSEGFARSTYGVQAPSSSFNVFPAETSKYRKNKPQVSRVETKLQAMLISAREADSMLPPTQLPEVGMPFDVTVTHVEHPGSFFIQRSPDFNMEDVYDIDPTLLDVKEELEALEKMALQINKDKYFQKYEPLKYAKKGLLCCGRYTEDDMWYRGQVLSVVSDNPLRALVRYFDYGNSEFLTGDRMRGFPSDWLDLPIQSTHCSLADLNLPKEAADSPAEGVTWSPEAKEQLIELVAGKILQAKIVAYTSPISVILYEHVPGKDDESLDISIGQTLATKVIALTQDPDVLSLESHVEGAPSEESCDVEVESDDVIEEASDDVIEEASDDSNTAEGPEDKYYRSESLELNIPIVQTTKATSDNLLEKLLAARIGFAPAGTPTPLLTPQEFSVPAIKLSIKTNPVTGDEKGEDTTDTLVQGEEEASQPEELQDDEKEDEKEEEIKEEEMEEGGKGLFSNSLNISRLGPCPPF